MKHFDKILLTALLFVSFADFAQTTTTTVKTWKVGVVSTPTPAFNPVEYTGLSVGDTIKFYFIGTPVAQTITLSTMPKGVKDTTLTLTVTGADTIAKYPVKVAGQYQFASSLASTAVFAATVSTVTAVANSELSNISFYPNPVKNEMYGTLNPSLSYNLTVVDSRGVNVYTSRLSNTGSFSINMENYERGTYILYLSLLGAEGSPKAFKIIKE